MMRSYPLHDLDDSEFEQLATLLCNEVLGHGVIPFAPGVDGGRDGRFHGRANKLPSEAKPWEGKIVIQAKHTGKLNASCSDSDFGTILKNDVLPAIEKLKKASKIDYYLLFTNRKLTGNQDAKIEDLIDGQSGIENLVIAYEKLHEWLKLYPHIVRAAKLNELLRPLQFDESDLKRIVFAVADTIQKNATQPLLSGIEPYIGIERKNELNELGTEYFEQVIKRSMSEFSMIDDFLRNPINFDEKNIYLDATSEINAKIALYRSDYQGFEYLLDHLNELVLENNSDLGGKKRLVRVVLHYMYCNCAIGRKVV
jgi:hypothetical protein